MTWQSHNWDKKIFTRVILSHFLATMEVKLLPGKASKFGPFLQYEMQKKNLFGNLTWIALISQSSCTCNYIIYYNLLGQKSHFSVCLSLTGKKKLCQPTNLTLVSFHHPTIRILQWKWNLHSKNISTVYIQSLQKQAEILLVNIIPSCWGKILCKSYDLRMSAQVQFWLLNASDAWSPFHIAFTKKKKFSGQYRWFRYSLKWKTLKSPTFIFNADVNHSMEYFQLLHTNLSGHLVDSPVHTLFQGPIIHSKMIVIICQEVLNKCIRLHKWESILIFRVTVSFQLFL